MAQGMAEWETVSSTGSLAIFGTLTVDNQASYNDGALDGDNTLSFGTYPDSSVIAITTVWGYFGGPPSSREIIEADILFNDGYFAFGDADVEGAQVMDLLNIAVHEIGHSAGMGDLYESGASLESMYGFSEYGETIKRDLYTGDKTGITKLYQ
jgi:hypothetical protein